MKKRLGIFLLYDPSGTVHDYVSYLLEDISQCMSKLVVVCNGYVNPAERKKLERFASAVRVRPNEGFDFAAWREGILDVCGWDEIRAYDELVLFNDSFFGPLYPFSKVFEHMDAQEHIDFWGLSSHGPAPREGVPDRPQYLQTYFLACRRRMLESEAFEQYWTNLESCATFAEHADTIACRFTEHFEKRGFTWTAYASTFDLEADDISRNVSHHMYDSYEMVANRRFPIIKRKTFTMPMRAFLRFSDCLTLRDTLAYIEQNTSYDTNLIWDYLLKNYPMSDIVDSLCLHTVLSDTRDFPDSSSKEKPKVAVIMHLYYEDLFEHYLRVLMRVPDEYDIYITVSGEEKLYALQEMTQRMGLQSCRIVPVQNQGRDLSALLVGCKDIVSSYDYVCFTHDKKTDHNQYVQQGRAFARLICDGTLASEVYMRRIVDLFECNPRLGLAVPPRPYAGIAFKCIPSRYWNIDYNQALAVLSRIGIKVPMAQNKECLAVGSAFWFRTKALKALFDEGWAVSDFPGEPMPTDGSFSHGLERVPPLIAQAAGYATMEVLPESMASGIAQDYSYMLDTLVTDVSANKEFPVECQTLHNCLRTWGAFAAKYRFSTKTRVKRRVRRVVANHAPFLLDLRKRLKKG